MPKVTKEIIEQADKEGKTDAEIAQQCGVSRQAVSQMRKKYDLAKSIGDTKPVKNPPHT